MSASGISNEELKEEELAHYRREAEELIEEFLETAPQKEGSLFVVGCSRQRGSSACDRFIFQCQTGESDI